MNKVEKLMAGSQGEQEEAADHTGRRIEEELMRGKLFNQLRQGLQAQGLSNLFL